MQHANRKTEEVGSGICNLTRNCIILPTRKCLLVLIKQSRCFVRSCRWKRLYLCPWCCRGLRGADVHGDEDEEGLDAQLPVGADRLRGPLRGTGGGSARLAKTVDLRSRGRHVPLRLHGRLGESLRLSAVSQHADVSKNIKAWAVSQHVDSSKNTKAWAVSQHVDSSKNTKAWAASQHVDSSKNTKAWAASQHVDSSKNTKAWAASQHVDSSKNTKAWAASQHVDSSKNTKAWAASQHVDNSNTSTAVIDN